MQSTKNSKEHKMKSGKRSIPESICQETGCDFYGKPAEQGVCFHRLKHPMDKYVSAVIQQGEDLLKELKSLRKRNGQQSAAKWIKYLEGHVVCEWANRTFNLDELIHLRGENAKLRLKAGLKSRK